MNQQIVFMQTQAILYLSTFSLYIQTIILSRIYSANS